MRKAIPITLTPEENGKLATIVRSAVAKMKNPAFKLWIAANPVYPLKKVVVAP